MHAVIRPRSWKRARCPCTLMGMSASDFNDPYWVAVAAAAPVIGLAAAVSGEQLTRRVERVREVAARKGDPRPDLPSIFWLHYFNILAQAVVLFGALWSLSHTEDFGVKPVAMWVIVLGLVAVFVPSLVYAVSTGRSSKRDARAPQPPAGH